MNSKKLAAATIGLCLAWGVAYAGPGMAQDSQSLAAAPAEVPENVGATNDVIVLELGPAMGGGGAEEMAAMQMLLLQLLMMQSEMGNPSAGEVQMIAPPVPGLTGI